MLLKLLIFLTVAMVTVESTDSFVRNLATFDIYPGSALVGHVIKTLPVFKADCMTACKETLSCFSINVYKDQHGGFMCDLNKSNKKQSPESIVQKTGYEYAEAREEEFCVEKDCSAKEALPDNWYKFNSSSYKYFANTSTWKDAQQHCQTQGGDLASFTSDMENKFVIDTILHDLNISKEKNNSTSLLKPIEFKFDGNDAGLTFSGGAQSILNNGEPVLSLNGSGYAEIPRFKLYGTDFTFSIYINPSVHVNGVHKLFEGYTDSTPVFTLEITDTTTVKLILHPTTTISVSSVKDKAWNHILFTWAHSTGKLNLHLNGGSPSTATQGSTSFEATDSMYRIGDGFQGWMKNLIVAYQVLTPEEINILKTDEAETLEGAWIGLNDRTTEGIFNWPDGSLLTYKPGEYITNKDDKDCGLFIKINENEGAWRTENCQANAVFICQRKEISKTNLKSGAKPLN